MSRWYLLDAGPNGAVDGSARSTGPWSRPGGRCRWAWGAGGGQLTRLRAATSGMNTQQARPRPIRLMRPAQGARTLKAASRKQTKAARYRRNSSASGMARLLPGRGTSTSCIDPGGMGMNLRKTTELGQLRSERVGWPVGAEDLAEGVADLAHGGQVAEGVAHRGEQVVVAAGGVAEVGQGGLDGLDGLGVAVGAHVDQG